LLQAADKIDADAASVEIDATGAISLGAAAASDFTVAGDLTLEASGAGILDLKSAAEVQVSTALFDVNASGAAQIDSAAASWFKVAGAQLELATTGSGELDLTSAGLMDINAGAALDVDVVGAFTMDSTGAFSIDGVGASNLSTSGALTLEGTTKVNINTGNNQVIDIAVGANNQTVNIGTGIASKTVIIGSSQAGSATEIYGGTGNINLYTGAGGGIYITNESNGRCDIFNGGGTGPVNIVGSSATGARSVNIATGGTAAKTLTMGSTASTSATTVQTGTGAMTFSAGGIFDVNSAGAVTIDSSGSTISIGADAVNQNITIGTGGARQVRLGNSSAGGSGGVILQVSQLAIELGIQNFGTPPQGGIGYYVQNRSAATMLRGEVIALQVSPAVDNHRPQIVLADAAGIASVRNPFGVVSCGSTTFSANGSALISTVYGTIVSVRFASGTPTGADIGKPVYLSATPGRATLTAPSGSGQTVYRLGVVSRGAADSDGNWYIVWQPQFIAQIP